jgi:hypothetical protein
VKLSKEIEPNSGEAKLPGMDDNKEGKGVLPLGPLARAPNDDDAHFVVVIIAAAL